MSAYSKYQLLKAAEKGDIQEVSRILNLQGSEELLEAEHNYGDTALISASSNGHEKVVELLLSKGANLEAKTNDGFNALILASGYGHEKVVELLLSKGANIEAKDNYYGYTALILSSINGHKK